MPRRTTAIAAVLTLLALGSPLITGCSNSAGNIDFTSADLKYKRGDYQGAIDDYTKAIEIEPNKAYLYNYRASAKRKLEDNEGTDEDDKKADKLKSMERQYESME